MAMLDTAAISTSRFVQDGDDGERSLNLLVEGMHCPSCVAVIEGGLKKQPDVTSARLNLSTKRLKLTWKGTKERSDALVQIINHMGYRAVPFDPETSESFEKREEKFLLRCLAVAGFASGNLMLFSIPMWSADGMEMGEGTRALFRWIQALIAIPALAYSGMPFYRSAWNAVREWRTNMDVPISVAVILATAMSIFETLRDGPHAYFDSGVMLLFFLLIGRYLDARARGRARGAAHDLLQMMTGFATVLQSDGTKQTIPLSEIQEGMTLQVAAGEKIGADGNVLQGISEIDTSLITGETLPRPVQEGAQVFAGMINVSAPILVQVTKAGERSLLAEIVRLMETAEQSQARYVTLADKISEWYTPAVHVLAAGTFLGWWLWGGVAWQVALLYAATVLIITCPCALGLAVPVVQVLASGRLMRSGILLKSGSALERLSAITYAAFDKTGTLTLGKPELLERGQYSAKQLQLAASLASHSRHPLSRAVAQVYNGPLLPLVPKESPGNGLEAIWQGRTVKLGKASWCGASASSGEALELWLAVSDEPPLRFAFADALRSDAASVIASLKQAGIGLTLLSGDREGVAQAVAKQVNIAEVHAGLSPLDKCRILDELKKKGEKVLMIGDGLNDAPSLASASVSISPSSAMDITQNAADIVFQGEKLEPVLTAWDIARFSQTLVKENFLLAMLYNVIAIPLAVAGYVTPLIAAIAMSGSSLLVIANAMRLNLRKATPWTR
ncbi:MAG: cadmium-translocating P-type ATPase [Alphaproteobacteria bacterium]|nr:cadmium-translocating P-type ATPase [Alphaproteobacteria bacterium]